MHNKSNQSRSLSHYLPERVLSKLSVVDNLKFKRAESLKGGIIYFDLVKFTPLTSLLARGGPRGAEKLQEILLLYYTRMINIIRQFGGSVYQFAGDSVLAAFEKGGEETDYEAATRTATCAWLMKLALSEMEVLEIERESYKFSTKFSVSYGEYYQIILGNEHNFFDAKILGKPIYEVIDGEKHMLADMIVIDNSTSRMLLDRFHIEHKGDYSLLTGVKNPVKPPEPSVAEVIIDIPGLIKRCSRFLLPVLVKKILGNYQGFLAEFRDISSVFIQFDGLEYLKNISSSVRMLNAFFESIVDTSNVFGGTLIQTDFSDKGNVFLVVFGAPVAVEQKEIMAARFAQKIHEMRPEFPFLSLLKIGISTGLSYCGDMGSDVRKSYSVLGESVNCASRIMSFSQDNSTCIDSATYKKIKDNFETTAIENVSIKGISGNITLYKIISDQKTTVVTNIKTDRLFGRKKEIDIFTKILKNSVHDFKSLTLIGEAGVGKSRLVQEFSSLALSEGFIVVITSCFSYEKFTPFFPWKYIFHHIFQINENDSEKVKLYKIRESIESLKDVRKEWVPVFGQMLGIDTEEEAFTANLEPRQKNERISQITLELLKKSPNTQSTLYVIEDFHWMDDASINLLKYILSRPHGNLMFLLAMRPNKTSSELKKWENMEVIELSDLDLADARHFLRSCLNLLRPNEEIENEILARAHGNPFFIESIVYSLREQQQIILADRGKYKLTASTKDIQIPNTLQDVLLSRIDRLREDERAILKIAAVIGRIFTTEILKELSPDDIKPYIEEVLSSLEVNDFTNIEAPEPRSYIFKHILIRDVAYNSILSNTRKEIHGKLAQLLENKFTKNLEISVDTLAYHFLNSNDSSRALEYCIMAAERALAHYANLDAVYYFEKSLELLQSLEVSENNTKYQELQEKLALSYGAAGMFPESIEYFEKCLSYRSSDMDKSQIYIGLGRIYSDMGDTKKAVKSLEKALQLVGGRVPRSLPGIYISIAKSMILHEINEILPFTIRKVKENSKRWKQLKKQSEIFFNLDKIYFFEYMEKLAWSNFNNVIIADRLNDASLTSLAYANYGLLLVGMGMFYRAEKGYSKSIEFAEKSGNAFVKAISFHRYGMRGMYTNMPSEWREKMKEALITFEEVNDLFEIYVTITGLSVSSIFCSDFSEALKYYKKLSDLAEKHQANRFIAWSTYTIPFLRYMQGEMIAETIRPAITRGMKLSEEMKDLLAVATCWNYLCIISIRDNDLERILQYSVENFNCISKLNLFVPDTHIAYAHAAEGALICLQNAIGNQRMLHNIIRKGIKRLLKWGKTFSYVYGPAIRIQAQYYDYLGKKNLARVWHLKSIDVHEKTENRWETGLAYFEAAKCLDDKREEFLDKAESIFKGKNLLVESERLAEFRRKFESK